MLLLWSFRHFFQMDNQLFGARKPVLMYMSNEHADRAAGPALHIFVHKTSSCNWNAEIYKVVYVAQV